MRNGTQIITILFMDLKGFFKFTYWIAVLMVSYIIDLLIMASTLSNIIVGLDYLRFFGPGITLVSAFSASFILARKINMEKEYKYDYYLLSLPIKRLNFILGRALAGSLQGLLYALPLLIITFFIIRVPSIQEIFIIIGFILVFSLSMTCLAMTLATTLRGARNFTLGRTIIYLWLMFGSTIFYPIDIIAAFFSPQVIFILQINPLSFAVNLLRAIFNQALINVFDLVGIIVFMVIMIVLGIYAYDRSTNR